jgi:hypothetical protein
MKLLSLWISLLAWDQSHTVTTRALVVRNREATVVGRANYARSYVYTFHAKQGQKARIELESKEPEMKFSLTCDTVDQIEEGFAVKKWEGALPANCKYSVVAVMNDPDKKSVWYRLRLRLLK